MPVHPTSTLDIDSGSGSGLGGVLSVSSTSSSMKSRLFSTCAANFFAPTDTNSDRVTELAKRAAGIPFQQDIDAITDGLEFSVQIKGRLRHLSTSLSARSVVLQRPPRRRGDFPQNGLIVDIDSYETSEKTLNDVRIFIGQAKSNIDDVMGTTVTLWLGESS